MAHLRDLTQDKRNARRHSPRNVGQIEASIQRDGFGRSLLLANDGTIIAGNATADAAGSAGLEDVQIVESDGTRVIAVKRTDVSPDSPEFHRLALADNRAAELADWDITVLTALQDDGVDLSAFWFEPELDRLLNGLDTAPFDAAAEWQGMPEYEQENLRPVKQVIVSFASETDLERFARLVEQNVKMTTKSIWYPKSQVDHVSDIAYVKGAEDAA